jgi:hypothetical protein
VSGKGNVKSKMWLRRLIEIGRAELVDDGVVPSRRFENRKNRNERMFRFCRYFFDKIEAFRRSITSRKSTRRVDVKSTLLFWTVSRKGNVKSKMWLRRLIELGHTERVDNRVVPIFEASKIGKIETPRCSDIVDIFSTKSKLFVVPIFLENRNVASTRNRRSFFGPCLEKAMLRAKCGSVGLSKSVMQNSPITASFRFSRKIETTQCSDFVDIFSTISKLFFVPIFLENRLGASKQNRRSFLGPCPEKVMLRAKCGSVGLSKSVMQNSSITASFRFPKFRKSRKIETTKSFDFVDIFSRISKLFVVPIFFEKFSSRGLMD